MSADFDARSGFSDERALASLRPAAGEVVALLGADADARSLALRALGGLDAVAVQPPSAELGLLGANPRFFPWLSLAENLAFALPKATPFEREGLIANALVRVGLAQRAQERPAALAPAELQRLALARLFLVRPRLLLIEEPFAGLDAPERVALSAVLPDLCRQGRPAVVLATGDVEEAVRLADRVVVLPRQGGPAAYRLDNLLAHPRDPASVGFIALRRELRRALDKEGRDAVAAVEAAA